MDHLLFCELELKARQKIEDFRGLDNDDFFVTRQSLLNAMRAIWSEQFSVRHLTAVANILNHVGLDEHNVHVVLRRMLKAGLIRKVEGRISTYEMVL